MVCVCWYNTSSAHFLKDEIDKYFDGKPLKHYRDFKSKLISIDISEDDIAMLRKSGKFSNLILKYFPWLSYSGSNRIALSEFIQKMTLISEKKTLK